MTVVAMAMVVVAERVVAERVVDWGSAVLAYGVQEVIV